ncbi:hypothetical protein F4815DRAFT_460138 [Daldinia loculata]|nr:hypothetical protein F4815DRAFT_460138 [Daldinia loculata]
MHGLPIPLPLFSFISSRAWARPSVSANWRGWSDNRERHYVLNRQRIVGTSSKLIWVPVQNQLLGAFGVIGIVSGTHRSFGVAHPPNYR